MASHLIIAKGSSLSGAESFSHGIAGRYATALFEIAKEAKALPKVEKDIALLNAALDESADLRDLISNPVYTRSQQGEAIAAIASKMKLGTEISNTIGLMASKRRLFTLPSMLASVKALIAEEKGEVTAEVTSAKALTKAQSDKLAASLKKTFGKDIVINATVDESIIGGLIVKVGSKMIDTSIKSKLSNLQNTMKEVG